MRVPLRTADLLFPKSTRHIFVHPRISRQVSSSSSPSSSPLLSDEIPARNTRDRFKVKDDLSIVFEMPAPTTESIPNSTMESKSPLKATATSDTHDVDANLLRADSLDTGQSTAAARTVSPSPSTSTLDLPSPSSPSPLGSSSSLPADKPLPAINSTTPSPLASTASSTPNSVGSTTYPHDLQSLLAAHPALAAQYKTLATKVANVSAQLQTKSDEIKQDTIRNLEVLGRKLNEFTGYDEIERLKQGVRDKEDRIAQLRSKLLGLKATYLNSVTNRSTSQRDLNDLLQRKHLWSTADVERFTSLVRGDHENMRLEEESKKSLEDAEIEVERGFTEMMNSILNRYHEEQLWSDKLRSFSTYVSLTIMVANLIVFVTAIVFVEPWKRKRMVESFETKVEEMRFELEKKLDAVSLGLSTGAGTEPDQEARQGEETKFQDELKLTRRIWEEISLLKEERDQARLQTQPPISTLPLAAASSSPSSPPLLDSSLVSTSLDSPSSGSSVFSFHQTYPYVTVSYQSLTDLPRSIVHSTSQALSSSHSFLLTGWNKEGIERDLVIVGAGAALSGGLVVGILKEMMK